MTGALPAADSGALVDRLYEALSRGDVPAARGCCTDDLVVWHSFDRVEQTAAEVVAGWEGLVAAFPERAFVDVRRSAVPGGWVQRHLMLATTASGSRVGWPLCLFVTVRDGRIARIDEYIDRAGRYEPGERETTTPGLPPANEGSVL